MSTNIKKELEVRIVNELFVQALCYLSTESSLVLHVSILTEYLLEEFLVYLVLLEALNLGNLIAELRLHVLHSITLYLQELRNLSIIVWISLAWIESDDVAQLSTIKQLLLVVYLDIAWHQDSALNCNTAFLSVAILVKLTQITLEHIIALVVLCLLIATRTRCQHIYLLVDSLVVNNDFVVIHLIATSERHLHLRSHCYVKHKGVRTVLLDIYRSLLLRSKRLAKHLDLIVLNILVDLLADNLVDSFHLN